MAAEAAAAATEAVEGAAEATTEAATDAMAVSADAINAMIDGATTLADDVKATLKQAVVDAGTDPAKLQAAMDAVKAALGL